MLTILYITLGVTTIFWTRQLAGYFSMIQVYLKLLFIRVGVPVDDVSSSPPIADADDQQGL